MKIRQNKPQPLFRQKFSDWMASQGGRWTDNVQDQYLSWLTTPLYDNLLNGEFCSEPYDPYLALQYALKIDEDVEDAKRVLQNVSEILSSEIRDTDINSIHYTNVTNWQSAWNAYSEFIESVILPRLLKFESNVVEMSGENFADSVDNE